MITLHACIACGHIVFPARKLCHRCGGAAWAAVPCERGVIEAVTTVRHNPAVPLACVRTPQGMQIIVRLDHAMTPGADVALYEVDGGGLWARRVD